MTVPEYYAAHKAEILKLVAQEHMTKPEHTNMKFEFVSQAGHKYFSYKDKMGLPTIRTVKHGEFMDWYLNGIHPRDHKRIRDELFNCLAHIRAKTKESGDRIIQAGLLLNELELRATVASPLTGLVNIAANLLIREDENPNTFSATIHEAKCDDLEAEILSGNSAFFFSIPQLNDLLRLPGMSSSELNQLLARLQSEGIRLNAVLKKVLDYMSETKIAKTTSELRS